MLSSSSICLQLQQKSWVLSSSLCVDNSKQYCQRKYVLKITFDPPHLKEKNTVFFAKKISQQPIIWNIGIDAKKTMNRLGETQTSGSSKQYFPRNSVSEITFDSPQLQKKNTGFLFIFVKNNVVVITDLQSRARKIRSTKFSSRAA